MVKILIALLVAVISPSLAQSQLIDNFSDGDLSLLVTDLEGETVIQDGLAVSSTVGSVREVYAGALERSSMLDIDTVAETLNFNSSESFGYFSLRYGFSESLNIDLTAEGANAIQLDFESVTPGLVRGIYEVNLESANARASQSFSRKLFALPGSGKILLPLRDFRSRTGELDFTNVSTIVVEAARVEPNFQIVLNSVSSVRIPLGDCNQTGVVDFNDIPYCNQDGVVDFEDIAAFIAILQAI